MKPSETASRQTAKKFHLRTTLLIPFVLQIVAAVGLVGYLSFRNGQQAVNEMANRFQDQVEGRVSQRLDSYLATPTQVNTINLEAITLGLLDPQNLPGLTRYFWKQMQTFEHLSYINFGSPAGAFVGIGRENDRTLYLELIKPGDRGRYTRYALDAQGKPGAVLGQEDYAFQAEAWYANAVKAGKPVWSSIYQWSDRPEIISISSSYPVYNQQRQLIGVIGIDFILGQISEFLRELEILPGARVFIIERDGMIVASSSSEKPYTAVNGKAQRLNSLNSQDPLIQASATAINQGFWRFKGIKTSEQFELTMQNGEQVFVHVRPWQDQLGLDWLIVVAVPESSFMGQINENTRNTILLCFASLIVAITLGVIASRWLTRPIIKLTRATEALANGNFDQAVVVDDPLQIIEIEQLATTFNAMTQQLKVSFVTLEKQRNSFARFFPVEYLKFLQKQDVTHLELGDHVSKEMTIMFSDIRSFTTLAEKMTPKESFDFVNTYLQRVSPEIRNHNGFVVKFMGDGMMAVFPDRVEDALEAGIAQFAQLQLYNQERELAGYLPIDIGLGLHVGHMMVGMVGEHNRVQGDALSDNVNLTARLEGLTKYYGVSFLISDRVLEQLSHPDRYSIRFLDRVVVKGRTEAIAVYEVLDVLPAATHQLKLKTLEIFEQGLRYYAYGQLPEARQCFEQMLAIHPADKTAQLYLTRIQQMLKEGLPPNWAGVWVFTQK